MTHTDFNRINQPPVFAILIELFYQLDHISFGNIDIQIKSEY